MDIIISKNIQNDLDSKKKRLEKKGKKMWESKTLLLTEPFSSFLFCSTSLSPLCLFILPCLKLIWVKGEAMIF